MPRGTATAGGTGSTRCPRSPRSPSPPRRAGRHPGGTACAAWPAGRPSPCSASEVPPRGLLALDRLEQRLEVALAEAARAVPLDQLEEDRRAVAERLGEDLEQVALVVAVDQDAEPAQIVERLVDVAHAAGHVGVVRVGRAQELDAIRGERLDGLHDVACRQRDVLRAGALVELEVLVDL